MMDEQLNNYIVFMVAYNARFNVYYGLAVTISASNDGAVYDRACKLYPDSRIVTIIDEPAPKKFTHWRKRS